MKLSLFIKLTFAMSANLILWSLFVKQQVQFVRDQFIYPDVNQAWNDGIGQVFRVLTFIAAIVSSYIVLFLFFEGDKER